MRPFCFKTMADPCPWLEEVLHRAAASEASLAPAGISWLLASGPALLLIYGWLFEAFGLLAKSKAAGFLKLFRIVS